MSIGESYELFLQRPAAAQDRILHPAVTVRRDDTSWLIRLAEVGVGLECEENVFLFFEQQREFMQQPATVVAIHPSTTAGCDDAETADERPVFEIRTLGEPVSAESRQCYRVSTVISDRTVSVGERTDCTLLDVSATGFSVSSAQQLQVGDVVPATLSEDGRQWTGNVCIQSARELQPGLWRYGLHCGDGKPDEGDLCKGLRYISMAAQRAQLRRLSGAA
jgi:hypothetical protein